MAYPAIKRFLTYIFAFDLRNVFECHELVYSVYYVIVAFLISVLLTEGVSIPHS